MAWDDWGSLFGSIAAELIGQNNKAGKPNWDQIERLMALDTQNNRFDRNGLFSGWAWDQDPETGRWTQSQTLPEGMQAGVNRLVGRATTGAGMTPFESPEQFSSLLDAKMANQMARHGLLTENPNLQRDFGELSVNQRNHPNEITYPDYNTEYQNRGNGQNNSSRPSGDSDLTPNPILDQTHVGTVDDQMLLLMNLLNMYGNQGGNTPQDKPTGWQGDKGKTGWDWLDNSGWLPTTWRDDYNATDIEKLFGQKDIGSLAGLNAPEKMGKLASWLFGIPALGGIAEKLFGYNPDKNYFSPVDPNNPYQSQGSGANMVNDLFGGTGGDGTLPNSPALPDRGWSNMQAAYDPRGSISGGGAFNYATRLKMPTHSGTSAQG